MGFKMKPSSFRSGTVQGTSAYLKASALKETEEERNRRTQSTKEDDPNYQPPPPEEAGEEEGDYRTELIAGEDYSYYGNVGPDGELLGETESEKEIDRQTRDAGKEEAEEETTTETKTETETETKPKKEEKAYGGTRTWSEGMEASGGQLNEWAKKAKTLDKNSAEYAEVQNKINEALGSKVRHSVPEVTDAPADTTSVESGPTTTTDSKKGREVTRDYDSDTGTSTKTVTKDGDVKREVVRTGQGTKNRGDDTVTRTRYTKDGGKVVTEKDALNRTRTRYDADGNVVSGGETKERGLRGLADRAVKRFSKEGREAAQERRRQERVDKGPTIIQARKQAAKQRKEAEEQASREAEEARRIEEGVGPAEEMTSIDPPTNEVPEKELITKTGETPREEETAEERLKRRPEFGEDTRDFSDELTEERGEGDIYMEQQEEQADLEATDAAMDEEQLREATADAEQIEEEEALATSDAAADEEALADQADDVPGAAMENIRAKFEETGTPPIYDDWADAWENMNPGQKAPSRDIFQKMFPAQSLPAAEAVAERPENVSGIKPLEPTPISNPGAGNDLSATTAGDAPEEGLSVKQRVKQRESFSNFRDLALELETAEGRGQSGKANKIKRKMMEARQAYIDAGGDPSKVDMRNLT